MVDVEYETEFEKKLRKIKDLVLKKRIIKQLDKIIENPNIGKPMRFERKGTREVYISSFRLSYRIMSADLIYILDLYHKDSQ